MFGQTSPEPARELSIDLDCDDTDPAVRECRGQDTGACTEIQNEVVRLDARRANQLRCQLATAEKVLAAPA